MYQGRGAFLNFGFVASSILLVVSIAGCLSPHTFDFSGPGYGESFNWTKDVRRGEATHPGSGIDQRARDIERNLGYGP